MTFFFFFFFFFFSLKPATCLIIFYGSCFNNYIHCHIPILFFSLSFFLFFFVCLFFWGGFPKCSLAVRCDHGAQISGVSSAASIQHRPPVLLAQGWSSLLQPERGVSLWAASSSSVRCRCLCCRCRCVCVCVSPRPIRVDAGGDAPKRPETPRGIRQERSDGTSTIKAPAIHINADVFIWKEETEAALSSLWLTWQAGMQVERLGQDRSHLSWRREEGKENLRSGLLNALDKKKKEKKEKTGEKKESNTRSANSVQALSRDIYKPPQVWRIISEGLPQNHK